MPVPSRRLFPFGFVGQADKRGLIPTDAYARVVWRLKHELVIFRPGDALLGEFAARRVFDDFTPGIDVSNASRHVRAKLRVRRQALAGEEFEELVVKKCVTSPAEAERLLRETPRDWGRERAGSLSSLNAAAAGIAARAIEDFVEMRITENGFWMRIEFDERGRLRVAHPSAVERSEACCCRWAGLGDEAVQVVREVLG